MKCCQIVVATNFYWSPALYHATIWVAMTMWLHFGLAMRPPAPTVPTIFTIMVFLLEQSLCHFSFLQSQTKSNNECSHDWLRS
jgi:hypothetical protein